MAKPYTKEQSIGKKSKPTYKCTDGTRLTQSQIDSRLKRTYNRIHIEEVMQTNCSAYPHLNWNDHDHTISQARCKKLGKTELIWDVDNIELSSRLAHNEWESYRSGEFEEHENVIKRMLYVKKHDPEGFEKRFQHLSDYRIIKALKS